VLVVFVLLISSFSGCSKNNSTTENNTADATQAAATVTPGETKEANEYGWVVPDETLTITVYAGEGDQEEFLADVDGGKAVYDKWLLDNMNVVIDWQMYSVSMEEKINLMLASNDYPEVVTWLTDDLANKFIAQGKATDLTELIQTYGDNITRRMGGYLNFLREDDGSLYKLAQYWGENPNVAGQDFGARYDYWLELGDSEIYKTPEEYYDVMTRILANHPTNADGLQTYAFTSQDKNGQNFLTAMLGAYGFVNGFKVNDDGTFTHWLNTPEGLEIAKFVNKCYRNNLIEPDFLANGYEEYIAKQSSGQILGNFATWWYSWVSGHQTWAVNEGDAYNVNERFMNVSVAAEGVDMADTSLITSNYIGSYRCVITDKCTQPEAVLSWINWENSELGNFITGWGAPSEDNVWKIADDGTWQVDDAILDVDTKETSYHQVKAKNGAGIYMIATNCNWLKTDEYSNFDKLDSRIDRVSVYDYWPVNEDGSFSNEGVNICWGFYSALPKDVTLYATTFNAEDEITITKQTIADQIIADWATMITASSEDECIALFNQSAENCNAMGLQDLTDYYQQSYEKNKATFGE